MLRGVHIRDENDLVFTLVTREARRSSAGWFHHTVSSLSRYEFSLAHCAMRSLHIAHDGACATSAVGSTQTPGGDAVYRFFCTSLSHQQCGDDQEILCGSDGHTYTSV